MDTSPNPEEILIAGEEEAAREAAAAPWREWAAALKAVIAQLTRLEKGALAAFLIDDNVRRHWPAMSSAEVADLLDHTPNWTRVHKCLARQEYPCGGGKGRCGRDQPACAHERGRKKFSEQLLRSRNQPKSN